MRVAVGCEGGVNRLWWPHLEGRERLRAAQTAGGRGSGYCQQATWKTGDWGVGWGGGGVQNYLGLPWIFPLSKH